MPTIRKKKLLKWVGDPDDFLIERPEWCVSFYLCLEGYKTTNLKYYVYGDDTVLYVKNIHKKNVIHFWGRAKEHQRDFLYITKKDHEGLHVEIFHDCVAALRKRRMER